MAAGMFGGGVFGGAAPASPSLIGAGANAGGGLFGGGSPNGGVLGGAAAPASPFVFGAGANTGGGLFGHGSASDGGLLGGTSCTSGGAGYSGPAPPREGGLSSGLSASMPHVILVIGEPDAWRRELSQQLAQSLGWGVLAVRDVGGRESIKQRIEDLAERGDPLLVLHCNHADAGEADALQTFADGGNHGIRFCKFVCLLPYDGQDSHNIPCINFAEQLQSKLDVDNADVLDIVIDQSDASAACSKICTEMLARPPGGGCASTEGLLWPTRAVLDDLLNFRDEARRELRSLHDSLFALSQSNRDVSRENMEDVRNKLSCEMHSTVRQHVEQLMLEGSVNVDISRTMLEAKTEFRAELQESRHALEVELEKMSQRLQAEMFSLSNLMVPEGKVREILAEDSEKLESKIRMVEDTLTSHSSVPTQQGEATLQSLDVRVATVESRLDARHQRLQQLAASPHSRSPTLQSRSPSTPPRAANS